MSFFEDIRILLVPGLNDSGPKHWQSRWQALYPSFERFSQSDWTTPDLERWSSNLSRALRSSEKPVIVVAHSFGCLATVYCTSLKLNAIHGALLVAPADPEKFSLSAKLTEAKLCFPTILIGSDNDPWMESQSASMWAKCWGSNFVNAGKVGHINADSQLEEWLFGLSQLQRLAQMLQLSMLNT